MVSPEPSKTFEQVFDEEFGRVVRLVYALTRSQDVAQDAAQDAFARLFEQWPTVSNPAGFVRTVAINRVRDRGRHLRVQRRMAPRTHRSEQEPSEVEYLADALAALPKKRRAMVVLRFYEQRTVDEIAEILGIPAGTVKSGLARSMNQLREALS
ncbi:MAG: sigma-70 family RNA polymerase sigma factor [Sulfitobacter sp.]|nr:sigma-70 family RNA polymerase sigma factor [Sulfitobacter sp.]